MGIFFGLDKTTGFAETYKISAGGFLSTFPTLFHASFTKSRKTRTESAVGSQKYFISDSKHVHGV
jgi:hypothetical protein